MVWGFFKPSRRYIDTTQICTCFMQHAVSERSSVTVMLADHTYRAASLDK